MEEYLIGYGEYLTLKSKSAKNTTDSYLRDIRQFIAFASVNNIYIPDKIDSSLIKKYLEHLSLSGKSPSTSSRIMASLRSFFKYLISIGVLDKNPAEGIKPEKAVHKLPCVLDQKEVLALLAQPDGNDYKSIRDKAMFELLYATGLKVSQLISLCVTDVNLQIGIIHLNDDNSERIIPIYPDAVKTLSNYLLNVRPILVTDSSVENLFTNMSGKPMTRQGFWKIIKQYAELAGIKKDITPHTLRHSFAIHLLENGAQLKDIKEMLGHSDISSTQVYAQLIKSKYTNSYAKFHPLAR